MKVIVAGHQKTGTKTLNNALTLLGYNVYDFLENFYYLSDEWKQIVATGGSTELFYKMYKDIDAVCDFPCLVFWEEIHKAFPDAKIILTMRDNDDDWFKSMMKQLHSNNGNYLLRFMFLFSPTAVSRILKTGATIARFAYGVKESDLFNAKPNEMYWKLCYRRHNAHVMMNAPKDKLLVYNCKEGWEPLCKFLGVDIPDEPFPHKNKGGSIFYELEHSNEIYKRLKCEAIIVGSTLVVVLAASTYAGLRWFNIF